MNSPYWSFPRACRAFEPLALSDWTWASPSCFVVIRSHLPWALKRISTTGSKSRVFGARRMECRAFGGSDLIKSQIRRRLDGIMQPGHCVSGSGSLGGQPQENA